jgi:SNF2-related domain/Helicase conserved C-terminal domain
MTATPRAKKTAAKPKAKSKAKKVLQKPQLLGWNSSDEDEIARRRLRGQIEITGIEALEKHQPLFGTFRVTSSTGGTYAVEIRDLAGFTNSCGCADHQVNRLGTCKHIEGVLAALKKRRAKQYRQGAKTGPARVEIFLARNGEAEPRIVWPKEEGEAHAAVRQHLAPWLGRDGALTTAPEKIAGLIAAFPAMPAEIKQHVRISGHFAPWIERARGLAARAAARRQFAAELEAGKAGPGILKAKLLPYQVEGMLHLAFGERALLADEMGLGKTIQAIAACEFLRLKKGIRRVLVVCPASVKAEWEDQIARFTDQTSRLIFGSRAQRLALYGEETDALFTIVNYEQVLGDADDINRLFKPGIVVLDEAQRIKNWHTKTAKRVKELRAPYAFVLTGTPVENRIDEVYSIVQYLDPEIFGPLFRFNRDFYELDDRGRPIAFKNMVELNRRLKPVMLRRRKADVENELPGRTVQNFFVRMEQEQQARYDDYQYKAAILIAQGQRRPLTPKEFERLQLYLACMRMLCDTPAILDPSCRISPKLEELENILGDLLQDESCKAIIFSEWERMLQLVRGLAAEMGIDCAWHTGSVPQHKRRAEISRFKADPACRLFLSTDAGATGLNLQAANAVINIDLPWNPAKLEQRIARAWRKNQTRPVSVINLVTENSIEHNILHLLAQKQAMADGVLDGQGDLDKLDMPSGRKAMIDRMQQMMKPAAPPRIVTAEEALTGALRERHGDNVLLVEARSLEGGAEHILIVLDGDAAALASERERLAARTDAASLPAEIISRDMWETMQRLAASGLVAFTSARSRTLHRKEEAAQSAFPPAGPEEAIAQQSAAA